MLIPGLLIPGLLSALPNLRTITSASSDRFEDLGGRLALPTRTRTTSLSRDVSSLLGHASPQITLTTYADQWPARLDQTTAIDIADVLFGSKTVAESRKESVTEEDASEEIAGYSEAV